MFGLFLFLFRHTDFSGTDTLDYAVNIFLRWDPLIAVAVTFAAKTMIVLLAPALITIILTIVFGRFFCNWVCPLGTCLDLSRRLIHPIEKWHTKRFDHFQYPLLIILLIAALFSFPIAGLFDPLSILIRSLTLSVDPGLHRLISDSFNFLYFHTPGWFSHISESVFSFLKRFFLPFHSSQYTLSILSLCILLLIFLLEKIQSRFWCRNICPLGALLGFLARFSPLRAIIHSSCLDCGRCGTTCRMGAIDSKNKINFSACSLCFDCMDICPVQAVQFQFSSGQEKNTSGGLTRRAFLMSASTGIALPVFFQNREVLQRLNPGIIRPPGALPEISFLNQCIRCGECMKVCIGNALHPTFLEAGLEGMFTPRLIARLGYCVSGCTLCGQVCPTGAIKQLQAEEKQKTVIGKAVIDRNLCLPYARNIPCMVCEEHCPTADKAIKFRTVPRSDQPGKQIRQPYIVDALCIGCGICEFKCPVNGYPAIRVIGTNEI